MCFQRSESTEKRKIQEETEETTSDDDSTTEGKRQRQGRGLATIAVSKDTLHESAQLLKVKERTELAPALSATLALSLKQWNYWRPGNSKGKGKGPEQSYEKVCVRHRTGRLVQLSHSWVV